jgi:ribosomal protein S18 acetylase RimI-like enzyme
MRLTVKACRATEAPEDCRRNAAACLQVLRGYGISNITSAKQDWWANPDVYALLLVDSDTGEPLGGVRLQRWGNGVPLPLECALSQVDARVHAWVARFATKGIGELCGLWRSPAVRGLGLGAHLTCMGIALASQANTRTLVGLCDTRSVPENARLGLRVDRELASEGRFEYPRPGLFAHLLRLDDALHLPGVSPGPRSLICSYRARPAAREITDTGRGRIELHRDLRLPPPATDRQLASSGRGGSSCRGVRP